MRFSHAKNIVSWAVKRQQLKMIFEGLATRAQFSFWLTNLDRFALFDLNSSQTFLCFPFSDMYTTSKSSHSWSPSLQRRKRKGESWLSDETSSFPKLFIMTNQKHISPDFLVVTMELFLFREGWQIPISN